MQLHTTMKPAHLSGCVHQLGMILLPTVVHHLLKCCVCVCEVGKGEGGGEKEGGRERRRREEGNPVQQTMMWYKVTECATYCSRWWGRTSPQTDSRQTGLSVKTCLQVLNIVHKYTIGISWPDTHPDISSLAENHHLPTSATKAGWEAWEQGLLWALHVEAFLQPSISAFHIVFLPLPWIQPQSYVYERGAV